PKFGILSKSFQRRRALRSLELRASTIPGWSPAEASIQPPEQHHIAVVPSYGKTGPSTSCPCPTAIAAVKLSISIEVARSPASSLWSTLTLPVIEPFVGITDHLSI